MTTLKPITRETLGSLLDLSVKKAQERFVAPNPITIAQVAYEQPGSHVWGLWEDETAVGLLAMIDPRTHAWPEDGDDPDAAYLWRLMVDARHQGKGHGTAAVNLALVQTRAWGLPRLSVTAVPGDGSPLTFYKGLGFRQTGRILGEEIELTRDC